MRGHPLDRLCGGKARKRSGSHRRAKAACAFGRATVVEPLDEKLLSQIPCPLGEELFEVLALVEPRLDRANVEKNKLAPEFIDSSEAFRDELPLLEPPSVGFISGDAIGEDANPRRVPAASLVLRVRRMAI